MKARSLPKPTAAMKRSLKKNVDSILTGEVARETPKAVDVAFKFFQDCAHIDMCLVTITRILRASLDGMETQKLYEIVQTAVSRELKKQMLSLLTAMMDHPSQEVRQQLKFFMENSIYKDGISSKEEFTYIRKLFKAAGYLSLDPVIQHNHEGYNKRKRRKNKKPKTE